MRKILVTGENGYISSSFRKWVADNSLDYEIHALSVRGEQWKTTDFSVYDVILHLAGIAHVSSDRKLDSLYYKVNRDLSIEIARQAKEAGVKQFIFMSSIIVYGGNKGQIITHDTQPSPSGAYGQSKLEAEQGIEQLADDSFKVAVIRPPMVYGKHSKGNYPRLSRLSRKISFFPDVDNQRSIIHIDNLCKFMTLIIDRNENGLFFPQNCEIVRTSELVKLIAEVHGKKIKLVKLFNGAISIAIRHIRILDKVFGNSAYDPSMSQYAVHYQIRSLRESIEITER